MPLENEADLIFRVHYTKLVFVIFICCYFLKPDLNNPVYISADAGYFSVVCFSKAIDPQLASFKVLDVNTSKTH